MVHLWHGSIGVKEAGIRRVDQTTPDLRTAILGAAAFQATFSGDFNQAIEFARQALADGIPPNCPAPAAPSMLSR